MSNNATKVFITKFALTRGIIVHEVEPTTCAGMVRVVGAKYTFFHKGEYCNTLDEAVVVANKMREKKLISLQKQMDKISKMDFTIIK